MGNQAISDKLEQMRLMLIAATTNEELKHRLARVGYDAHAMQEGLDLYAACIRARDAAHLSRLVKRDASEVVTTLSYKVDTQYRTLAHVSRTLWKEHPAMLSRLGVTQRRRTVAADMDVATGLDGETAGAARRSRPASKSLATFLDRARTLYNAALADGKVCAALDEVGISIEQLQTERMMLQDLERSIVDQERFNSDAKERTVEQYVALNALTRWTTRLAGIAAAALVDRPDLLRYMGIKSRLRRP